MEPELICRRPALERARAVDLLAQPQHRSCNRKALSFVGVKQRLRTAAQNVRKLPPQVVSVLNSGVQSLAASRRVYMRCITCKEDAAHSQAIDHTDRRPVHRTPRDP